MCRSSYITAQSKHVTKKNNEKPREGMIYEKNQSVFIGSLVKLFRIQWLSWSFMIRKNSKVKMMWNFKKKSQGLKHKITSLPVLFNTKDTVQIHNGFELHWINNKSSLVKSFLSIIKIVLVKTGKLDFKHAFFQKFVLYPL